MAQVSDDENGVVTGINVTPLVDITLVLLIIFIVTAKMIVTPALPADLPRGTTTSTNVPTALSVMVPSTGPMTIDGQVVSDDAMIVRKARSALAANPELRAVINADGGVPHRTVVHVLDLLRQGGVEHVAFGALPAATSSPEGGRR